MSTFEVKKQEGGEREEGEERGTVSSIAPPLAQPKKLRHPCCAHLCE